MEAVRELDEMNKLDEEEKELLDSLIHKLKASMAGFKRQSEVSITIDLK